MNNFFISDIFSWRKLRSYKICKLIHVNAYWYKHFRIRWWQDLFFSGYRQIIIINFAKYERKSIKVLRIRNTSPTLRAFRGTSQHLFLLLRYCIGIGKHWMQLFNLPLYQAGLLKYCKLPLLSDVMLFSPTATSCSWHRILIWETLYITIEWQVLPLVSAATHCPMHCPSEVAAVWLNSPLSFSIVLPMFVIHGNHIPIVMRRSFLRSRKNHYLTNRWTRNGLKQLSRLSHT